MQTNSGFKMQCSRHIMMKLAVGQMNKFPTPLLCLLFHVLAAFHT